MNATVVIGTADLDEHASAARLGRLSQVIEEVCRQAGDQPGVEVLLADATRSPAVVDLLRQFPTVRRFDASGLEYEATKYAAIEAAGTELVVLIDGDCIPVDGWLEAHVDALREGAPITAGVTTHGGGFVPALVTIANSGFFFPARRRPSRRYVDNNFAVRRAAFLEVPYPISPVRVTAELHFRQLEKHGITPELIPEARVEHAFLPFVADRLQKGYESYTAYWGDTRRRARWFLRTGPLFAFALYGCCVIADEARLRSGWRELGMSRAEAGIAVVALPALRLIDLVGMMRAVFQPDKPAQSAPYDARHDRGGTVELQRRRARAAKRMG